MNISAFGLIWHAYGNPYAAGGSSGLNLWLLEIMNVELGWSLGTSG
jgi:uncharacterized protein